MVDPEKGKKWRSTFPPLWEDVLSILDTGTEAGTAHCEIQRTGRNTTLISSPQTIIMQIINNRIIDRDKTHSICNTVAMVILVEMKLP